MRDAARLEALGVPTVTVSEDAFEAASRTNAQMMGMPDLPLVVIPRLKVGEPRSVAEHRVVEVWERIAEALVKRQRQPAPRL
ncbi:MAG: hypothetical protein AAB369_05610 [Chloroflexota bacterium]